MKRIALAAFSTLAALVLLFMYPTSTGTFRNHRGRARCPRPGW